MLIPSEDEDSWPLLDLLGVDVIKSGRKVRTTGRFFLDQNEALNIVIVISSAILLVELKHPQVP